jgi:hypothetical protein
MIEQVTIGNRNSMIIPVCAALQLLAIRYAPQINESMNRLLLLFFLLLTVGCNSQDSLNNYYTFRIVHDKNLSKVQSDINNGSFEINRTIESLDPCIFSFMSKLTKSTFLIANPDQPFNATDAILDTTLPDRQLSLIFKSKNSCFIEYAHGGIGLHYHIAWFEINNGAVTDFWVCNSSSEITHLDELKRFINSFDRRMTFKDGRKILNDYLCF